MITPWLLTGGKFVMHHPFNVPVYLQQIAQEKVHFPVAPPVLLNLLLHSPDLLSSANLSSVRVIGSGSAPLSAWMVSEWQKRGITVMNFFASNEGTVLASGAKDHPDPADRARYPPPMGRARI